MVTYLMPSTRSRSADAQIGMQVPGPLQSSSDGRARRTTPTAKTRAYSVVNADVTYDWPTSRLRGIRRMR
eukprot:436524-Prymnesium_polylepis.2